MILKVNDKSIELVDIWYRYLYQSLIKFSVKNDIDLEWRNDTINIPKEKIKSFVELLECVLADLLNDCYVEPTHKQISKNSSRYEKIEFQNKVYRLNYRTDLIGILGYGINYLILEIENTIIEW